MAHSKVANAMVVHPRISGRGWNGVRRVASSGATNRNLTDQARTILGGPLDPDRYLFTHCTIVASVDTDMVPNARLGKIRVGSNTVNRPYADYHIRPECSQYVNNNGDSWDRRVLLASYPTFIGSHNFQEHVQVEEKSKGRIIDAVARDIGDSVYIDILVATNRKHATLINDIKSGKLSTLSMGCTTDFTICTKCGHLAVDETELCEHVKHAKLNTFLDESNQKRVIAELCGHIDYTDNPEAPGGVRFIEASWVGVPAFPGAVMRNILSTGETRIPEGELRRMLAQAPSSWSETAISKAAKLRVGFNGFGDEDEEEAEPQDSDSLKVLEDEVHQKVMNRVKKRIEKELREKELKDTTTESTTAPNDNVQREASIKARTRVGKTAAQTRYATAVKALVRAASSDAALVDGLATINASHGLKVSVDLYRAALQAGPISKHASPEAFLRSCRKFAGRSFTPAELRVVVRVGNLLSQWASINNPTPT